LLSVEGLGDDLLLADVFGVSLERLEDGATIYLTPTQPALQNAVLPERHVPYGVPPPRFFDGEPPAAANVPRVRAHGSAEVLGVLSLPYGYPAPGTYEGQDFASIHSSPPWTTTLHPAIVRNRYGKGTCTYVIAPIEAIRTASAEATVTTLLRQVLPDGFSYEVDAPPNVWVTLFHQPERSRYLVWILEQGKLPNGHPVQVTLSLSGDLAAAGEVSVRSATTGAPIRERRDGDAVRFDMLTVDLFDLVIVNYEAAA
jgi:hypothetical protein